MAQGAGLGHVGGECGYPNDSLDDQAPSGSMQDPLPGPSHAKIGPQSQRRIPHHGGYGKSPSNGDATPGYVRYRSSASAALLHVPDVSEGGRTPPGNPTMIIQHQE